MEFQESALLALGGHLALREGAHTVLVLRPKFAFKAPGRQELHCGSSSLSAPERAQTYISERVRWHQREDEQLGFRGVFTQFSVFSKGCIPPRAVTYSSLFEMKGFPRTGEFSGKTQKVPGKPG